MQAPPVRECDKIVVQGPCKGSFDPLTKLEKTVVLPNKNVVLQSKRMVLLTKLVVLDSLGSTNSTNKNAILWTTTVVCTRKTVVFTNNNGCFTNTNGGFSDKNGGSSNKNAPRWGFHLQILCGNYCDMFIMYHEQRGGLHVWTYSNMLVKATHVTLTKKEKKRSILPQRRAHCSSLGSFKSLHLILFCFSMSCFLVSTSSFPKYGSWKWNLQWIQRSIGNSWAS